MGFGARWSWSENILAPQPIDCVTGQLSMKGVYKIGTVGWNEMLLAKVPCDTWPVLNVLPTLAICCYCDSPCRVAVVITVSKPTKAQLTWGFSPFENPQISRKHQKGKHFKLTFCQTGDIVISTMDWIHQVAELKALKATTKTNCFSAPAPTLTSARKCLKRWNLETKFKWMWATVSLLRQGPRLSSLVLYPQGLAQSMHDIG